MTAPILRADVFERDGALWWRSPDGDRPLTDAEAAEFTMRQRIVQAIMADMRGGSWPVGPAVTPAREGDAR